MSKEAIFTMKLVSRVALPVYGRGRGSQAARVAGGPLAQPRVRPEPARSERVRDLPSPQVESSRSSMHAGLGWPNDQVEVEFAARRRSVIGQPGFPAVPT